MTDDVSPATAYPPGPWHLNGELLVSVLRVPLARVPGLDRAVPPRHRPVLLGGDVLVGLALARYVPGGTLAYDELLTAVLTRPRGSPAPRVTVPQIWVTSAASAAGGRALWGIPKDACTVRRQRTTVGGRVALHADVTADGLPVATLRALVGRTVLPGLPPLPVVTAQRRDDGSGVVTGNRARAAVRTLRARWDLDPDGPLGHLAGSRPLLSVAFTDAALTFGRSTRPIASPDE